jgi:hypothetical protein
MTIGTHFIWHILIALVTYLAMRSLILSLASDREGKSQAGSVTV